jgi:hypothetical protein
MGMNREQRVSRRALALVTLWMIVASSVAFTGPATSPNEVSFSAVSSANAQSSFESSLALFPEMGPAAPQSSLPRAMRDKQKRELRKYQFDKMKEHGDELVKLANSLQEDLHKSNENILSLEVVEKAQKIEKLAKKIQQEARLGT